MKYNDATNDLIAEAERKAVEGKKLTKEDRVLLKLRDGQWHEATELAYGVSWRFGGYLHNLKKKGVDWEKERVPNVEDQVFRYRLCEVEG